MIDQIEIIIEDNLKEFYDKLKKYLNSLIDKNIATYTLKSKEKDEFITNNFQINGKNISQSTDVINIIFPGDKEAQAQFIPFLNNNNRFKLKIKGEGKNLFKERIKSFIQQRGLKSNIKESKLKEIIRKYVKEAIQRA